MDNTKRLNKLYIYLKNSNFRKTVKFIIKYLPRPIQDWLKMKVYKKHKEVLVDAKQLKPVMKRVINHLINRNGNDLGDYFEFGVFNGTSLISMYKVLEELQLEHIRLFGFDSFEGLPADAAFDNNGHRSHWSPGMFKSSLKYTKSILKKEGVKMSRVNLVKGWFSETLNTNLLSEFKVEKASIIKEFRAAKSI